MARESVWRILGCPDCACGLHDGCGKRPLYRNGEAEEDCMCLPKNKLKAKTAKARVKKAKEKATAAVEKTERSMKIRVAALEKVLWGNSFEGKLADRRAKVIRLLKNELVHK